MERFKLVVTIVFIIFGIMVIRCRTLSNGNWIGYISAIWVAIRALKIINSGITIPLVSIDGIIDVISCIFLIGFTLIGIDSLFAGKDN